MGHRLTTSSNIPSSFVQTNCINLRLQSGVAAQRIYLTSKTQDGVNAVYDDG